MNEDNDVTPEMLDSVQQHSEQSAVNQNSSILNGASDDELRTSTVLTKLEALPFQDDRQKTVFFESVQRLQDKHVIQIFNLGVVPLHKSATESSKCLEEVVKLFEICSSFCYTADVSKRVAFEYYVRALKFCFPSQPTQCLSTAVVSKLLELVQIFQEGKLASIVCDKVEQMFNAEMQINGTRHFFCELLEIFETRRDDGYIAEIVDQTQRFASADASISCIKEHVVENVFLRSDHVVSPVLLTNWIKLLKSANVSNGFAFALAKIDDLRCTEQFVPLVYPRFSVQAGKFYESTVCHFVGILEEMKRNGSEVSLPSDEERLRIFFDHIDHFCYHPKVTETSIRLLATACISNEVLVEVVEQFCCKEKRPSQHRFQYSKFDVLKPVAFDLVFKALSLFPDGELVNKLLKFWKETVPGDQDYQTLADLICLLVEGSSSENHCCLAERAERILDFLDWLPRPLLPLLTVWQPFLTRFIKIFPTSFQSRPEVLVFIHRAVLLTKRVPPEHRPAYVNLEHLQTVQFLEWVSQQSCNEEMKKEMIWLLMSCADKTSFVRNFEFSIDVIKQLSLCQQLQFSTKKSVVQAISCLAKCFKERERRVFQEFVGGVALNQNLELKDEIFSEILHFVKRCSDMRTILVDILQLLSLVSRSPLSGDRIVKLLQTSKKSGKGLQCGLHILQLTASPHHVLKKGANEYFDVLFSAFVDILKEDKDLCKQFFIQQHRFYISAQVRDVWSFVVARLISLGLFKQEIDSRCCLPVLEEAWELNSPLKMLQLYSQVRTSAVKVVDLLRHRSEMCLSPDAPDRSQIPDCVPQTFVSSLGIVVSSNVLSGEEKLLLVKKVCDIFVRCPNSLTEQTVENALSNLIPFSLLQDSNSLTNKDVLRLEVNQIEAILEDPTMMAQLSQLPVNIGTSLCSVFKTKNSGYFSRGNLIDVYHFIGSQEHLDEVFFSNFVPILEIAIQESSSVEGVLEIVEELVGILRAVPSERIPFIMVNFGYLLENQVDKQERELFLKEVVMKWDFSLNSSALSYLEVPRLLWKAFTTTNTPSKRSELIVRVQEILKKTKHVESFCATNNAFHVLNHRNLPIRRRIACCELECLVLHSSLSTDEAALACDLSFRSFNERLRCFTFSDIQIEEGCIKFAPQETRSETADSDNISAASASVDNVGNDSSAIEPQPTILTPVSIAQKVIHHLKRVLRQGEDLTKIAFSLWDLVFDPRLFRCEAECTESLSFLDDHVDVLLSILAEASSTEIMLHWAKVNRHHLCQCSEVVLKACKVSGDAEDIGMEAMFKFQAAVSTTMETIRKQTPSTTNVSLPFIILSVPCFRLLKPQLKHLSNILDSRLPIDVTTTVLNLFQTNFQAGVTVADIISSWSCKHQTMELVNSVHLLCQKEEISSLNPAQSEFVWQLLKAFGRFCKNSCEDLLVRFEELIVLYDPEDAYAFNRLPKWRQTMVADGFPADVIDCWCVAFLTTPLENLSSRDVDAIVDLNSHSFQLVAHASVSQSIKRCIFPEDGFQDTHGKGIMEPTTKERLRLARLLGEFINILKLRKPEENRKDAVIREIVVDACDELCKAHENQNRRKNDLYKIHEQKLKDLFTEVFGKQRKTDDNDMTGQTVEGESRGTVSVARQSSYYHNNLPRILNHNKVYEPLLVLLRRWLSRTVVKPTLASHTLEIVQLLFSDPSSEVPGSNLVEELHDIIQVRVLSLEENQALMAQLQAVGYNQKEEGAPDLWSSPMVKCSGYLTKREDPDIRVFRKKLTQVLRRLWNEWKNILHMLGVSSIKVGETDVCTKDLFGLQASLEEMEEQASAVKKAVNQIEFGNLDRSVRQLMRLEQQHRARIEKLYKGTKSSEACGNEKGEMKKFVAVWENRFLENIKLCSERIPGCYAPNGFHSEKPVLCALSVDNRILTVFKEEKNGRREEIENVEVKLLEAGMYVYGLHTSGHDYVTDELWAAFFKMLLEERLVPSIVLSNESPGFDWIKEYVQPVTSHPCPWKWELHQGIVPPEEDYFDYRPINAALWPHFYGLTEFVTLTRENVASFQFKDFKDAFAVEEKENRTKEMTGKAIQQLKNELRLVNGDSEPIRKALAGKLAFVVKQTIKSIVDGDLPTEETVKELIDMDKLTYRNHKVQRTDESRQQYAAAVLRACTENFEL